MLSSTNGYRPIQMKFPSNKQYIPSEVITMSKETTAVNNETVKSSILACAKTNGKKAVKAFYYTAGAVVVGGLGYLAYQALKGVGADTVAEAVSDTASTVADAATTAVVTALRG